MTACETCNRANDRNDNCHVCHGGGPYVGDEVEFYSMKPGGAMVPVQGKIARVGRTTAGTDFYVIKRGKAGTGKEYALVRSQLSRVRRP